MLKRVGEKRRRCTFAPGPRPHEQGSIVIAMTVVLVLFLIATATLARALDGLSVAARNREYSSALGVADAGLSDALFRIDQQSGTTSSFCIGTDSTCTLTSVPALGGVQYRAVVPDYPNSSTLNPDEFIVQSEGTVRGIAHATQAIVQRDVAAQYAAFAVQGITLHGNGSTSSIMFGPIGSDGFITCDGGGNDGTNQQVYGGGSNNCPIPIEPPGSYDPQPPFAPCSTTANSGFTFMSPCVPSNYTDYVAKTCPSSNTFSGTYNVGVYVCYGDVTFAGTVSVSGTVGDTGVTSTDDGDADDGMQVFVLPTVSDPSPTVNLSGATINPPVDLNSGDPTTSRDFRLYVGGTSPTINPGNGSSAVSVKGLIWAPTASLTVNGGQMQIVGSLVLGSLTVNGNPNLNIEYDYGLNDLVQQNWRAENYTEIPVSCFSDSISTTTYPVPLSASCPTP